MSYSICRLADVLRHVRFLSNGWLSTPQSDRQVSVDTFGGNRTQRSPALGRVPHGYRHDRRRGKREERREMEKSWRGWKGCLVHGKKDARGKWHFKQRNKNLGRVWGKVKVIRNLEECVRGNEEGGKRREKKTIYSQAHTNYSTVKAILCQLEGWV